MMRIAAWLGAVVLALVATAYAPSMLYRRDGEALFDGDVERQDALGRGVFESVDRELGAHHFGTGSARFDGEWLFGSYLMAALGYGQLAIERPAERGAHVAQMEAAIDGALRDASREFDTAAWGHDPLDDVGTERAHAAYLGYLSLALAIHRCLEPESKYAEQHDAIVAHLARRLSQSPTGLTETYPGEVYPVDNAAFIGSLGPYDAATGSDHRELVEAFVGRLFERYVDETGLVIQSVHSTTGAARDAARGSGTALAAYFLSFVDRDASGRLYDALRTHLRREAAGLVAMREYPAGADGGGDIDSGPIFLGLGLSSTGFALGASRAHGDRDTYAGIWALTCLFGAPVSRGGAQRFAMGGPIGDAVMFAMATTPRRLPWDA